MSARTTALMWCSRGVASAGRPRGGASSVRFLNRFGDSLRSPGTFSMVSRKVADAFLHLREIDWDYLYALRWLGFATAEVDYQQAERAFGKS